MYKRETKMKIKQLITVFFCICVPLLANAKPEGEIVAKLGENALKNFYEGSTIAVGSVLKEGVSTLAVGSAVYPVTEVIAHSANIATTYTINPSLAVSVPSNATADLTAKLGGIVAAAHQSYLKNSSVLLREMMKHKPAYTPIAEFLDKYALTQPTTIKNYEFNIALIEKEFTKYKELYDSSISALEYAQYHLAQGNFLPQEGSFLEENFLKQRDRVAAFILRDIKGCPQGLYDIYRYLAEVRNYFAAISEKPLERVIPLEELLKKQIHH